MIIVIKDFKETQKIKTNIYFSAVPSAFFFFTGLFVFLLLPLVANCFLR